MLGGADNPNGELPSYITGANTAVQRERDAQFFSVITAEFEPVRLRHISKPTKDSTLITH